MCARIQCGFRQKDIARPKMDSASKTQTDRQAGRQTRVITYLAEPVEDVVKEGQHGGSGNLHHVVERLAAVVANTAIRVEETGEDGLHQLVHVVSGVLEEEIKTSYSIVPDTPELTSFDMAACLDKYASSA